MTMTYQLDARGDIRGQDLLGETVVISEKDCGGLVESTFTSGTLKLAQSKGKATILRSVVRESTVVAVKRQRDTNFFSARFINCTFHGVYSGIDFGSEGRGHHLYDFGAVEGCDFTDATLDGCRFFNTDVSSLRLPRWPHAVLLDFSKRAADVAAMTWPGELGRYMRLNEPDAVKAVVLHIPSLARLVACTEEQIRQALEEFGGVVM
jgi:hypothetical protein